METEKKDNVIVWWFPKDFSQSKLGGKSSGSNACTLIVLLVAQKCHENNIKVLSYGNSTLCQDIIDALGESIMNGNRIHANLIQTGALQHVNLTVPEAIEAAGPMMKFITEWKSMVYLLDLSESLFDSLSESVNKWYTNPPAQKFSDLFVVLIVENRSILFIFQSDIDKVTIVDSHQHLNLGAVIAQSTFSNLRSLCAWYSSIMGNYCGAKPTFYELSFLFFKKYDSGEELLEKTT